MKIITIEAHEYDELGDEAKAKARDKYRSLDEGDLACWSIRTQFETDLETLGLENLKAYWSLNYCQGDGVAFEGRFDLGSFLRKHRKLRDENRDASDGWGEFLHKCTLSDDAMARLEKLCGDEEMEVCCTVTTVGRYTHRNSMEVSVECYSDATDEQDALVEEVREDIAELLKSISKEFERIGYADIEYQNSDEAVAETIKANEYLFTAEGCREVVLN